MIFFCWFLVVVRGYLRLIRKWLYGKSVFKNILVDMIFIVLEVVYFFVIFLIFGVICIL